MQPDMVAVLIDSHTDYIQLESFVLLDGGETISSRVMSRNCHFSGLFVIWNK